MNVFQPIAQCSKPTARGFTLLELLVASAVAVIILGLIVQVLSIMLDQADRSMGSMARVSEADSVLDSLERDLQSLFWIDGTQGMVRLKTSGGGYAGEGWDSVPNEIKSSQVIMTLNPSLEVGGSTPGMESEYWGRWGAGMEFFVHHPETGRNDPGGVYAVGYQIKRKQLSPTGSPRYYLMRSQVSAHQSFLQEKRFAGSAFSNGSFSSSAFWAPSTIRFPNENHIIAENVVDFGIRAYRKNNQSGSNWVSVFPLSTNENAELSVKPELVEVMIRVLTPEGAMLLENLEQNRAQGTWEMITDQYSEVYVRRFLVGGVL
jgi:prepilin-type N-terminal cleavage/methylation domain-containing protein